MSYVAYSRLLEINGETIFKHNAGERFDFEKVSIRDLDWVKSVFMIGDEEFDENDSSRRYFTNAELKFTDTRLGANVAINNYPQFTRYADVRVKGRNNNRQDVTVQSRGNNGMGHFYSNTFDDNSFNLYTQFGVPEFNSLIDFFTRGIDSDELTIAKTGRVPTAKKIGKAIGTVAAFLILPVITLSILVAKTILDIVMDEKPFNYYYMKPTMYTYWVTVNSIVNAIASELGMLIPEFLPDKKDPSTMSIPIQMSKEDIDVLANMAPGIIDENGFIDMFAVANRSQVLANKQMQYEFDQYDEFNNSDDDKGFLEKIYGIITNDTDDGSMPSITEYLNNIVSRSSLTDYVEPNKSSDSTPSTDANENKSIKNSDGEYLTNEKNSSSMSEFNKNFDATVRGGGGYAIFRVDYPGSQTESLSNTVSDIETGNKIKSVAKGAKDTHFSFAGGNILGDTVKSVTNTVVEVLTGVASGLTYGLTDSITAMLGGAYVDIPKAWDDSEFTFSSQSYTISLVSNSAHPMAQLTNIYIPLAMIMAGSLPLSAGKASYTSPFLCSTFLKGIQEIELGMITNVSITRGSSTLAFNKQKRPLAIDVTFTVTDLTNLMTASVNKNMFSITPSIIDDSSPLGRYIKTLCSRDLLTDKYMMGKAKIRLTRKINALRGTVTPAALAFRAGGFAGSFLGGLVADYSLNLSDRNR